MEPVIEAEVAYSTVTENALLREAVFKGLCELLPLARQAPGPAGRRAPAGSLSLGPNGSADVSSPTSRAIAAFLSCGSWHHPAVTAE